MSGGQQRLAPPRNFCSLQNTSTRFLLKAVDTSSCLWKARFKLRDKEIRRRHGTSMSAYVTSFRGRDRSQEAKAEEDSDEDSLSDQEEQEQGDPPHMMEL